MDNYTRYSRNASSFGKKKLWNPTETLGIVNTDPGYQRITCIGHSPRQGPRCRNPIKADKIAFITATLNEIAYLHPDSPAVTSQLYALASPALCVRNHQGQVYTIVSKWQENIKHLGPQILEDVSLFGSTRKQNIRSDASLKDLQERLRMMKDLMASLQDEIDRNQDQHKGYQRREESKSKSWQEEDCKRREQERRRREERAAEAKRQEEERKERERLEEEQRRREEREEKERKEEEEKRKREQQEKEEKEEKARQEKIQQERDRAAHSERIRQKAQKVREERMREEIKRAKKEREEWDQAWAEYQKQWDHFKACASPESKIGATIPWPVKSGAAVVASSVKQFMEMAVPRDDNIPRLLRLESIKWHPDNVNRWPRSAELTVADRLQIDMVCQVVNGVRDKVAGKSSKLVN